MVEDEELERLREEKMDEIQEEDSVEDQREQLKKQASQYLTPEARSRLGNLRAARPELASSIESQIVRLGRTGQVDKITDDELKDILQNLQNSGEETSIKFRK